MTITVNHSTAADGTFSSTGATAWNANHTLSGIGTMAEQNANSVAITGGSLNGVAIGQSVAGDAIFDVLTASVTNLTNVTSSAGIAITGTFIGSSPSDGLVMDYSTGWGRFSAFGGDGFQWYNAGLATTKLMELSSVGALATLGTVTANGVLLTGNLGTVTSVSATVPSFLSVSGSPITTNGTLALTYSGTALPVLNGGTGVTTSTGSGSNVLNTSPTLTTPAITGGTISNLTQELIGQSTDQGTGVLQVTGQSTFNGAVTDKSLNLQGGNNLLTYSQDFTNAAWTKTASTIGTGYTAPDGTSTAQKLQETATTNAHWAYNGIAPRIAVPYTFSFDAKAGEVNYIWVQTSDGGGNGAYAVFNISTGVISTNATLEGTGWISPMSSINPVGNGWYRCSLGVTPQASGVSVRCDIGLTTNGTFGQSYAGTAGNGVYIWNAQGEQGSVASAYTLTTSSTVIAQNNVNIPNGNVVLLKPIATFAPAPTIASASTIAPIALISFVSGTTTINTITASSPLTLGGGQLTLIPTGLFLTSVTGNIALASTAIVGKALIMTYDKTTALWYPSY